MRGREFGARLAGWLEVIGIDPDYQKRAVSGALLDSFRRTGGSVVNTIVNWNDGDLIDYFRANGFDRGDTSTSCAIATSKERQLSVVTCQLHVVIT